MYPREIPDDAEESEKRLFAALRALGNDWIVIHDQRFVVAGRKGRPARNGQADFVLLHPNLGLLVLEAKGGGYEVSNGKWFTFPKGQRTPMDRGPFQQAVENRYALATYISETSGVRGLPAGHAVVFTDGAPRGNLGPEAPRDIVVDGSELATVKSAISRIADHWFGVTNQKISKADFQAVVRALLPTGSVAADRRFTVDVTMIGVHERTERQVTLTSEQLAVVEATAQKGYVAVLGAAGTGKTIIATRRAADLASKGQQVLLIADQKYLHKALQAKKSLKHGNITLGTPAEVAAQLLPKNHRDRPMWEVFVEVAESGRIFDAVIVDEAQSLDDDLLESLQALSNDRAYFFADPYQRDSQGMWRPRGGPHEFWLTQNCRNSFPIAKLVARLSGALPPHEGPQGPTPRFVEAKQDVASGYGQVMQLIKDYLKDISEKDLAVLTCAPKVDALALGLRRAGITVARRAGDEGVTVVSADEFRGCESPAVLLVAGPSHACDKDRAITAHYVATSRAVADLTILGNPSDWDQFTFMMEKQ